MNDLNDGSLFETEFKKKKRNISTIVFAIINILSALLLIFSIYMIDGVENVLRYSAMGFILVFSFVVSLILIKTSKKGKTNKIVGIILLIVFSLISLALSYFIYRTYSSLDNMNKEKITFTTAVVVKSDSKYENINDLKDTTIGIVVDETSIDGYVIGLEIINDNKLEANNKVKEYADISSMISDLYSKKIDAIIVSENYTSMFKSVDKYKSIENETKIIFKKSKTFTKDQIAKYTGDEILNLNASDVIDKPFTVLVMGIDTTGETLEKNATGNGDSLMLITFNPDTLNSTILSIPRDSYVPIACFPNQKENKITHAAWNGEGCMIKTIENFTGINIDYYVKINFQGVIKLVEALNGIEVDVPVEFCESNSKRSTRTENLICLKTGKQKLNGEQALALARHRKTLNTGDLQRGKNQQLVVQGILNKIKSIRSANQLLKILDTISNSMDTNFTTKQILSFYNIAKKLLATSSGGNLINMQQLYLSGASQMIYDEGMGLVLSDYIVNEESLNQVIQAMKENLGLAKPEVIKKMSYKISAPYKMKVIGENVLSATKTYALLPSFVGESQSYAAGWLSNNGVAYSINTEEVSGGYYDGQVISQSAPAGKRLDLLGGGVTITVAKVVQKSTPSNENSNTNKKNTEQQSEQSNNTEQNNEEPTETEEPIEEPVEDIID